MCFARKSTVVSKSYGWRTLRNANGIMRTEKPTKLVLRRQMIRVLEDDAIHQIRGGAGARSSKVDASVAPPPAPAGGGGGW
jgi:hypothetical protein